jgi:hypothetical protein
MTDDYPFGGPCHPDLAWLPWDEYITACMLRDDGPQTIDQMANSKRVAATKEDLRPSLRGLANKSLAVRENGVWRLIDPQNE